MIELEGTLKNHLFQPVMGKGT